MVKINNESFVIADIPGIIEGASKGVGLGLNFLRHVERTRLLLHVIDVSGLEGRNPVEDFNIINNELKQYSQKLASRKQIIVASKADIENPELYKELEEFAKKQNMKIFKISSATNEGIENLLSYVAEELKKLPKEDLYEERDKVIYTLEEDKKDEFFITKEKNTFILTGKAIERLMGRININDNESMYYFHKCLENIGVNKALKDKGIKQGDIVKILDYELEWFE